MTGMPESSQVPRVATVSRVITHSAQDTSPETGVGCWARKGAAHGPGANQSPAMSGTAFRRMT